MSFLLEVTRILPVRRALNCQKFDNIRIRVDATLARDARRRLRPPTLSARITGGGLRVSFQGRMFESVGRLAVQLPRFRGRSRACLILFKALGLEGKHTFVEAVMRAPVAYRVRLDLHSWLQRIAFLMGEYEEDTARLLCRLQQSIGGKGYMLDIGANIGMISLPTAILLAGDRSSTSVCVISVEAIPDNAAALRRNIELNNAGGMIKVIEKALGDRAATLDIQVEGDLSRGEGTGTANILPAGSTLDPNGTYQCVRIPIEVVTLDSLHAVGEIPDSCRVVKIDTDGYDLKVLQGATKFISKCRPVVFGEFSAHCMGWHGQSVVDVISYANSMGYLVWQRVERSKPLRFSRQADPVTFVQDLLLVPREHEEALAWCCAQ
ncbi:MAG: FkbM family methyltransferase [Ramlibacter sp.]